jgi:signal peptidase I
MLLQPVTMENNIIRSIRPRRRNPFLSLLLSFGVPGLGQLYNGEGLKGVVIALCTVVPLLLAPLTVIAGSAPGIFPAVVLFTISIIVRVYACIDAPVIALWIKMLTPGRSNTPGAYILFTLSYLCISLLTFAVLSFMFTVERVSDARMEPTIADGDIVLVNRYRPSGPGKSDVVLMKKEGSVAIARVIGKEGDTVVYDAGSFLVNGSRLSTGIMTDEERNRLKITNRECLFIESDGFVKYPVCIQSEIAAYAKGKLPGMLVAKNMLLIAFDNRKDELPWQVIPAEDISGVVAGIILGSEPRRSFSPVMMLK